jgi:predicted nucleic acid-binding Zn ribbon protein
MEISDDSIEETPNATPTIRPYYLPGCGVEYVSWFPNIEEKAIARKKSVHEKRVQKPRSNCSTCGMTRVIRYREKGKKFCSEDCRESFDPQKSKSRNRVPHKLPDQSYLCEWLAYDPTTGYLYWNKGKKQGERAFTSKQTVGYFTGKIEGKAYLAHRVIWKMMHGEEPDVVDHINNVKDDNRIENLRSVSQRYNIARHFAS